MAIIYSYPEKTTPAGGDFLVITDSEQPAPNKNRTKSLKIENLADYIISSTSGITGSGTLNTIAMFTPDGQSIGDSFIKQTIAPNDVIVSSRFNVSPGGVSALSVSQSGGTGSVTIPGSLRVDGTYYDASGDEGDNGDVLLAKGTPGNMVTRWNSLANAGIVSGSGTTNTLPIWTDGPNGVLGDSIITYDNTSIPKITIGPQPSRLEVDGDLTVNNRAVFSGPYVRFDSQIEVNGTYYDAAGDEGTDGDVLVAKGTPGNMVTRWVSKAGTDIVSGSGTTDFVPKFTDGPNGVIGDSFIKSYVAFPGTGNEQNVVEINPTAGANPNLLKVNTGEFTTVRTDSIVASDTGSVTMLGGVTIGNGTSDNLNINSTTNLFLTQIKAGPTPFGNFAPGEDYVLVSDNRNSLTSALSWKSQDDYVSGAIAKLIPFQVTASAGGSSTYSADNNIVEIGWTGGNGTYVLNIPSAATIPYRNIRFVTNSTFPNGASDKVEITAQAGETIDGAAFFEISKVYEGVSIWSNGTEWIVIQAKAH